MLWYKRAFTLIELLLVVAVIGILAAILFPVFGTVRQQARAVSCFSNERQLGLCFALYTADNEGMLPLYAQYPNHDGWWWEAIAPYAHSEAILTCPEAHSPYAVNYLNVICYGPGWAWNRPETTGPKNLDAFPCPSETLVLADGVTTALYDPAYYWGPAGVAYRHLEGFNALFLDGHTHWLHHIETSWWGH